MKYGTNNKGTFLFSILILILIHLYCPSSLYSQTEIELRTDGIVVPRTVMTNVQSPAKGMLIFDTVYQNLKYYDGIDWKELITPDNIQLEWASILNTPSGFSDNIDDVDDADADATNELQTINKSGNTVTLSNGGGSFTDAVDDADNDPMNEVETWSTLGGIPSGFSDDTDNVDDADSDPLNELQTLSKSGNVIRLNPGGGSVGGWALSSQTCPSGRFMTGINAGGSATCFPLPSNLLSFNGTSDILSISGGNFVDLESAGPWTYLSSSTIRYGNTSGLKVGIGRTPVNNQLEVNGNASKNTVGDWLSHSDRRIKRDISSIENAYTVLSELNPIAFRYSAEWLERNPDIKDDIYYSFVAQEFEKVFPSAVYESGEYIDGDQNPILQIDPFNAQIFTVAAVKQLIEENKEIKLLLTDFQNQISKLDILISELESEDSVHLDGEKYSNQE